MWELRVIMYVGMVFQSGFRQCRSWWSSPWSSPPSPFWCSWVSCSPCPRVGFSTSLDCVKSLQVMVKCKNVLPTLIYSMKSFGNCSSQFQDFVGLELDTVPTVYLCIPIIFHFRNIILHCKFPKHAVQSKTSIITEYSGWTSAFYFQLWLKWYKFV